MSYLFFDSIWQRFISKVLDNTGLKEKFTEHDLRAKVASDASLDHAQKLLEHASPTTTLKVYRRKAELIKPTS